MNNMAAKKMYLMIFCMQKLWYKILTFVMVSSYIAQYPIFRIAQSTFYTLLSGRPVQSKTISASLGSIQPRDNFAKTART